MELKIEKSFSFVVMPHGEKDHFAIFSDSPRYYRTRVKLAIFVLVDLNVLVDSPNF